MKSLTRFPALKLLVGVSGGCLAALFAPTAALWVWSAVTVAAVVWAVLHRLLWPIYWCAIIGCGLWIGYQARGTGMGTPRSWSTEMPAVLTGTVQRVLSSDSLAVRCIVRGVLDAQALPAQHSVGVVLTIAKPHRKRVFLVPGNRIYAEVRTRVPRVGTLPGEWNERMYYSSIDVQWLAIATGNNVALVERSSAFSALPQRIAGAIGQRIQQLFPSESEGIARALLIGDKSGIRSVQKQAFSLAGTAHVLAVSGLHVGVIAVALLVLLGRMRQPWLRFAVFGVALCCYALLTGLQPSMVRATTMAILLLMLQLLQREGHLFNILCAAVVCMLFVQPYLLFSLGFYLSVASLAGIALLYPIVERFWFRFLPVHRAGVRFVATSLSVSLSASAVVAPLVAVFFSVYSLIAPVVNIAVVPLMSLGMVYTLCAVLCSAVSEPVAMAFVAIADALFRIAENITLFAASLPYAAVQGSSAVWVAVAASVATLYVCTAQRMRTALFRTAASVAIAALAGAVFRSEETPSIVVIPRSHVVAAVIPVAQKHRVLVLQDRKPGLYPIGDRGLERYLLALGDTLTVVATGPAALYCASRLGSTPVRAVLAPSLHYKVPKVWHALDSLEKRNVRVVNARQYVQICSSMVFYEAGKERVEWDVWRNVLTITRGRDRRELSLPQLSRVEHIALQR